MNGEIDDGHVGVVEGVQSRGLAKVQLLELDVVAGVGDGGAGGLDLLQRPPPVACRQRRKREVVFLELFFHNLAVIISDEVAKGSVTKRCFA